MQARAATGTLRAAATDALDAVITLLPRILGFLVVLGVGIALEAEAEPRLEIHVGDEAETGHQKQQKAEPPVGAVAPALRDEPVEPEGEEDDRDDPADRGRRGARPLPVEVLEVVEELQADERERASRIIGPVRDRGVVERSPGRILGSPDHGEEGVERRGCRLVDRGMLPRPDVEIQVRRDPHGGDHEARRGEETRTACRREPGRAEEGEQPQHGERRTSQSGADEEGRHGDGA